MSTTGNIFMFSTLCIAGAAFTLGRISISPAHAADAAQVNSGLREAVAAELERQLPAAVQKEVKKQLRELEAHASREARENSLASTIQTVRSQLELYRIQHGDRYPTMAQMTDWNVLIKATDVNGTTGKGEFGPYLQVAPINAFGELSAIAPSGKATAKTGWTYDEKTGELRAVLSAEDAAKMKSPDQSAWEIVK